MMKIVKTGYRKRYFISGFSVLFYLLFSFCSGKVKEQITLENYTCFETTTAWQPNLDLQTDLVLIRFGGDTTQFFQNLQSWQYKDYNVGGIFPINQEQILNNSASKRLKSLLTAFLNRGFKTIIIEEPSFKLDGTYNQPFQKYWEEETGTEWINPADSADLWYCAAKIKQKSFLDFLDELSKTSKAIALQKGKKADIFLTSSSSISATAEDKLISGSETFQLPSVDGVVGKIESDRLSFIYQNKKQNDPFPICYFNLSWLFNNVDQTPKQIFLPLSFTNHSPFPKELVAALMQPSAVQFQIIPDLSLSSSFQAGLFTFILESLKSLPQAQQNWSFNPWPKTGIIFSDTYMFQQGGKWPCELESFFQLAMPLLERGVPVQIVPLERISDKDYLNQFVVLFMSYEGYKPSSPEWHNFLFRWVHKKGGILFFYLGATNAFDEIEEWWSDNYDRPHEHLFELLKTGLYPESGMHKVGKGIVYTERNSPKELAKTPQGGEIIWNTYTEILMSYADYDSTLLKTKNRLYLERGPYQLIYVPAETDSFFISGNFIDLFTSDLKIIETKKFMPHDVGLLLNIDYFPRDSTALICSSSKIIDVFSKQNSLEFHTYWLPNTPNLTYVRLAKQPVEIFCQDNQGANLPFHQSWIANKNILRLETISAGNPLHFKIVK